MLMVFYIPIATHAAQLPGNLEAEQTTFDENEPLKHPVPLPAEALHAILNTPEGRQGAQDAKRSSRQNVGKLFRAAKVHLSSGEQAALVVIGDSPMSGADNTWFWVVFPAEKQSKVVLFTGGNSLGRL